MVSREIGLSRMGCASTVQRPGTPCTKDLSSGCRGYSENPTRYAFCRTSFWLTSLQVMSIGIMRPGAIASRAEPNYVSTRKARVRTNSARVCWNIWSLVARTHHLHESWVL